MPSASAEEGEVRPTPQLETEPDAFTVYARMWGFGYAAILTVIAGASVEGVLAQGWPEILLLALACACVLLTTWCRMLVGAHGLALVVFARRAPNVFDADWWMIHHDCTFLLAVVAHAIGKDRRLKPLTRTATAASSLLACRTD